MRTWAAGLALAAFACSTPPPAAEPPASDPPAARRAPAAAKQPDALSRADQLIADAAQREAEYQQVLKDEKERPRSVPIYNEFIVQGKILEGELPEPSPDRDQAWWGAQLRELRRRVEHNRGLLEQARTRVAAARAELQGGRGDAATARLALQDAEAEYERIERAFYRDSNWMAHMRAKAQEWGVPKEWWIY